MSGRVEYTVPKHWNGLCIVGEAPGEQEVAQGRPFVGRSGELLDRMLVEAGIHRDECWVGNAFRTRPPDNKIAAYFGRTEDRAQRYSRCPPWGTKSLHLEHSRDLRWLRRNLVRLRPRAVVTLGGTALWATTWYTGRLGEVAGTAQQIVWPLHTLVVPMWHPSYLLQYGAEHIPQQINWLQQLHSQLHLDADLQTAAQIVGENE